MGPRLKVTVVDALDKQVEILYGDDSRDFLMGCKKSNPLIISGPPGLLAINF